MTLPIICLAITSVLSGAEFYNYFKTKSKWSLLAGLINVSAFGYTVQQNFL
jgi:hypothetical protein